MGTSADACGSGVISVEGTVSLTTGESAAFGRGIALGGVGGDGVVLGTSNRPRRCDAVGAPDADGTTIRIADAVVTGVTPATGVVVATADGVAVAVVDVAAASLL